MKKWAVKGSSIIIEMIMMKNDHHRYHYQIKKKSSKCDKNTSFLDIRAFFTPYRFLYDVEILQKIILTPKKIKINLHTMAGTTRHEFGGVSCFFLQ